MSQEKDSIPHTSRSLRALWFCFLTTRCLMKTMEIANVCILRRDTHCTVHNPGSKIQLLLHLPSKNNWFTPVQKKNLHRNKNFLEPQHFEDWQKFQEQAWVSLWEHREHLALLLLVIFAPVQYLPLSVPMVAGCWMQSALIACLLLHTTRPSACSQCFS